MSKSRIGHDGGVRTDVCATYFDGKNKKEISVSVPKECPDGHEYFVIPSQINAHTHCGDFGFNPPKGATLEELVAPPNGLKHRYLASLSEKELSDSMKKFSDLSRSFGVKKFIDFREGGSAGCRVLREATQDAFILGRPIGNEYDSEEMDAILKNADGIGIPSITDFGKKFTEQCQEDAHKQRKKFAIHVSERTREDFDSILQLNPDFVVHMCQATHQDLRKCAEQQIPIAVCPRQNQFFGIRSPIIEMINLGAEVMFGTDNAMIASPDIFSEINEAEKIIGDRKSQVSAFISGFQTAGKIIGVQTRDVIVVPEGTEIPDFSPSFAFQTQ